MTMYYVRAEFANGQYSDFCASALSPSLARLEAEGMILAQFAAAQRMEWRGWVVVVNRTP